jgi:hypothetical protein
MQNVEYDIIIDGHCPGLVPRVLRVTGYGLKFWIRPIYSSGNRLGNHTHRTEYGITTLG